MGQQWWIMGWYGIYPQVNIQKAIEDGNTNSWFTHQSKSMPESIPWFAEQIQDKGL